MNEREYIVATNRVKISMALTILRDVLPGYSYGITQSELSGLKASMRHAEEKLFSVTEIEEDPE